MNDSDIDSFVNIDTVNESNPIIKININKPQTENLSMDKLMTLKTNKKGFFIEGGGTRGFYAIGIFKYLFEENPYLNLNDVDLFGGTSVGSYFAVALSLGYTIEDIMDIPNHVNLSKLIDSTYMFPKTFIRFIFRGYLYNDNEREKLVKHILNLKLDKINKLLNLDLKYNEITLAHLKNLIAIDNTTYKNLIINSVDINTHSQIFMTTLDNLSDNIKLYDCVLASSAIPLVFEATCLYRDNNNMFTYDKSTSVSTHYLIDGGLSTNNPLDYFLLYPSKFEYDFWLLKFTNLPSYEPIKGTIDMCKKVFDYLITGKNDIKMELVQKAYQINVINLNSVAGTLEIYTTAQIFQMINSIYDKCTKGLIHF